MITSIERLPDGSILAIEEVRTGKKTLALVSMRKSPAAKDFDSIAQTLLSNAQSDSGESLIVVGKPPESPIAPAAEGKGLSARKKPRAGKHST